MKKILCLFASASAAMAGMHNYNTCYLATSVGLDNLSYSPVGLHIDSSWRVETAEMVRNTFQDGHLYTTDYYGPQPFEIHGDTLVSSLLGLGNVSIVLSGDRYTYLSYQGIQASTVKYSQDSIVKSDSAAGSFYMATRDVFQGDSLHQSIMFGGSWSSSRDCQATATKCDCNGGADVWLVQPGRIEERHDDTLTAYHYTSVTGAVGVVRRPAGIHAPSTDAYRVDGSRRPPVRAWMPRYGSVPGAAK